MADELLTSGFGKGVLLKGIPFNTTIDDIKIFFKSLLIPDENIRLITYKDGKGTGLAFVKLNGEEEIMRAVLMDKNHIGPRYVDVVSSDESEMHHLLLQARSGRSPSDLYKISGNNPRREARDRSPIRKRLPTRFCYITGIPPGNNYKEVRKFFAGRLIGRNCIHLIKDMQGQFRGDGYVEFSNSEECTQALRMDGQLMEGSVVQVVPCYKDEVEEAIEQIEGFERERDISRGRKDRTPSPARRRREAYASRYGHDATHRDHKEEDFYTRFSEHGDLYRHYPYDQGYERELASYYREPGSHQDLYEYPRQVQQVDYHQRNVAPDYQRVDRSGQSDYLSRGGGGGGGGASLSVATDGGYTTSAYSASHGQPALSRHGERGYGRGGASSGYPEDVSHMRLAPLPPIAGNGGQREQRMVRMEGLPYNVTVQDILAFYRPFSLNYEAVRIQCREDGSPSGKAFVNFPAEKYARTAVHELNKRYLGGRMVELFLV